MEAERAQLQKKLRKRRSTVNIVAFNLWQGAEEIQTFPFSQQSSVKAWNSMYNLASLGTTVECPKAEESFKEQQTININVGGKVFYIPKQSAVKYPHTRIGSLALCADHTKQLALCDDFSFGTNQYFFDRDPAFFHHIFHFYTSGVLWIVREMCPVNFEEEMDYWGLSLRDTQRCCRIMFEEKVDEVKDYLKVEKELIAEIEVHHDQEGYEDMVLGELRRTLWNVVENPYSSIWAKAFAVFSNLLVLVSIGAMTMNTVEELRIYSIYGRTYMEWVEIFSILFFTLEYFVRFATTSNLKYFLRSALNFVDFVAVVPYFLQILFDLFDDSEDMGAQNDLGAMVRVSKLSQVLKVLKLMRIFRILKLARHSTGMRAFGFTLRQCYEQVCCLFLFISMGIFTFSALLHSVERDAGGSPFSSIPDAWWWAAVSISTVGYGDVVPVSVLGRLVAFACISFGIILNGMPISFLFNKFSDYYAKLKAQEYASSCVRQRFQLKNRLRRKFDICFHPPVEDDSEKDSYECQH